jgi:putative FmdB family regulatory protein
MPLYEYLCDECGHRFEKIQKFSDPLEDKCPKCGGPVHKLASSPAIQFKGSGFYITDYAKKDQGSAKAADGKAEKAEKAEKSDKGEKSEKAEKPEKSEKSDKTEASGKSDKGSSAGDTSSKTSSSPASPSTTSSTKDS